MSGSVASTSPSTSQSQIRQQSDQPTPRSAANAILAETGGRPATYDRLGQIEARLDNLARSDPSFAAAVRAEIMASPELSPVQRAQLTADEPGRTVDIDGTRTQRFAPGGMAWDPWIDSNRARNTPEFQALARLAGSTENAPIRDVMRQLNDRGITAAQFEAERAAAAGPDPVTLAADLTQMTLDLAGIVDPFGVADGANAVISLGRGIGSAFNGEWSEAGGHLLNGAISVAGLLPALGDLAKAGKIGKWAQTVADAVTMMNRSPELARTLEPSLREIKDLVDRIPQGALDALPASARESIERMKTQLDEVFGAGARGADEAAQGGARLVGNTLVLDANRGATFTAGGRTQAIGDTPNIAARADGRQIVTDVNGDTHIVRRPSAANYDSRVVNRDGTITYTRDGQSITYDTNGFPMFEAKADLYLSPSAINSGDDAAHFREANRMLGDALRTDPGLAQRLGLNSDQVAFLTRENPAGRSPPDLTWHHHQDTGRIQLVPSDVHDRFSGGHTGGMRIWGGGR